MRFLLALPVLAALCASAQRPGDLLISHPAPDFTRTDLDGHPVHLSELRGRVVLLNFWAGWCTPCLAEMPRFSLWQKEYGADHLAILGVSMDEDPDSVRKIRKRLGIDYPLLMGDAALGRLYGGVLGLPVTYLIDEDGVIRFRVQDEAGLTELETDLKTMLHRPVESHPGSGAGNANSKIQPDATAF